jgi:O-antigen/teichoic acid export membrane protein
VRRQTFWGLGIGVPCAVIGFFLLPTVLPLLYGDAFSSSVAPARILLAGVVTSFMFAWFKSFAGAIGKPELRAAIALVDLVLLLGLLLLLGGDGAQAAAIAWSAAAIVSSAITLFAVHGVLRRMEVPDKPERVPEPEPVGAGVG